MEDDQLRAAAFQHVRKLSEENGTISSEDLLAGFFCDGQRYPLTNPQRGIFKPRQMSGLLSIKTVYPRKGRKIWYEDQREVHRQIFQGNEVIDYAYMGSDPNAADNRLLKEAMHSSLPVIYFLGVAPSLYQIVAPVFIEDCDDVALKAQVSVGQTRSGLEAPPRDQLERRYGLRQVKQRLHQAQFREALLTAYEGKCALSGLPEPSLLDASHIIVDGDEQYGQPIISNGLLLSKLHHAAFDSNLLGIDPDCLVHVSEKLLVKKDGPVLEAMKALNGSKLLLPKRRSDAPDRDRLARRFEVYCEAN